MNARIENPRIKTLTLAVLAGLLVAGPVHAQSSSPPPDNIIILLADDLGWNDLPFFSPPINQDFPATTGGYEPDFPDASKLTKGERALIRPAVNRFAARMYARPKAVTTTTMPAAEFEFGTFTEKLRSGVELSYTVRPIDEASMGDSSATPPLPPSTYIVGGNENRCASTAAYQICNLCDQADQACKDSCCNASMDVLEGFGGLKRLQDEGVTFPRFYSDSSKCAPTRASLLTGRYPKRIGVNNNGNDLPSREVTIAEFLKQGCTNPADYSSQPPTPPDTPPADQCFDRKSFSPCTCYSTSASQQDCNDAYARGACYHTGLIGKWVRRSHRHEERNERV